jgi:hypothetical protein
MQNKNKNKNKNTIDEEQIQTSVIQSKTYHFWGIYRGKLLQEFAKGRPFMRVSTLLSSRTPRGESMR